MDIKRIFAEHEVEKQRKEQEAQEKREREITRRTLNAEAIEAHLRTVVHPVLTRAKVDIVEAGYPCELEEARVTQGAPESPKKFALRLKLRTNRLKTLPPKSSLEYDGNPASSAVLTVIQTFSPDKYITLGEIPLNELTCEVVEGHVERFLKEVLSS